MTLIEELKELLKKKKYAVSYAAKAINVSNATLHLWMNNNYKGNVKKIDDAVANFIEIEKLREELNSNIIENLHDINNKETLELSQKLDDLISSYLNNIRYI